jgi:glycosyltransferase involved in cell wall biosynthesis
MGNIKLAVVIPHRNDRPKFLANCLRMLKAQSLQGFEIAIIDHSPTSNQKDITQRYRIGYDSFRNRNFDLIAFIEDDDWYHSDYLKTMVAKWIESGRPDIIGTNYTIYYHIKLHAWFTMHHSSRSSAMNTLIKPDLNFSWPQDSEPYTDIHLWNSLKGITFKPERHIALGIKHGEGLCGGRNHNDKLERFINKDPNLLLLKENMDAESFEFYSKYFQG